MKKLLHFVNEIGLDKMLAALTITVLVFAFGYWQLSEHGSLVFTFETNDHPGFGDAVYFSIVTISSLGYGDIRPMGWARALVGLEVIVGLAFLGVLVAKISSVKQDYILQRLYTESVDAKLATYVRELEEHRNLYRITSQLLIDGGIDPELTTTFRRDSPGATFFSLFRQLLSDVSELMHYEASNNALFGAVDDSRIDSIYEAIRGVQRRTLNLWQRDPASACELVLCDNHDDITTICDLADRLSILGKKQSRNSGIVEICDAIIDLNRQIRAEVLPSI